MTESLHWSSTFSRNTLVLLLALLLSILPGSRVSVSGNDVTTTCGQRQLERRSRDCTSAFSSQLDAVRLSRHKFFTGVDVEIVRSVCSWFQTSVSCLQSVRDQCPSSAIVDDLIDSLLRPHLTLFELCSRHKVFEDYAMYQRCFHRLRTRSNACYADFRSRADDLVNEISLPGNAVSDYRRQMSLYSYCRELESLTSCVEAPVRSRCGRPATRLVDVLVRASVQLSPLCSDDGFVSHAATTTTTTTVKYGVWHSRAPPSGDSAVTLNSAPWRTLLATTAVTAFAIAIA